MRTSTIIGVLSGNFHGGNGIRRSLRVPMMTVVTVVVLMLMVTGYANAAKPKTVGGKTLEEEEDPDNGSDEDEHTFPKAPAPIGFLNGSGGLASYYGGLHASGIGFQYWNNYMMVNSLMEHLRNVPMVTYTGDGGSGGTGGGDGDSSYGNPPMLGGAYATETSRNGFDYSTGGYNTAPYGPGYAPAYEGQQMFQSGYPVYHDGVMVNPQSSALDPNSVYRGQAQYGDPGTLIYSVWGALTGGDGKIKDHKGIPGYDTKQYGIMAGIDLFGSCDCRSGLFYGYQGTEMKQDNVGFNYQSAQSGDLFDPTKLLGEGEEFLYETEYDYLTNFYGNYSGKMKTNNHLIGIYHQFGSEFVYNIATLRLGYNRVKTNQTLKESGTTTGTITESKGTYVDGVLVDPGEEITYSPSNPASAEYLLQAKYNEYLGGVNFERGANLKFLNVFTFTPRGAIDYTYLYRDKFYEELANGGRNEYRKRSYHSLRSQVGADLALDMYPGDMHLRLLLRGSWVHEFLNYYYGKTSLTDFSGNQWSVLGNSVGRDWALTGAGLEWTIVPAFMIFGNYDYLKNKYADTHYGNVGIKVMW